MHVASFLPGFQDDATCWTSSMIGYISIPNTQIFAAVLPVAFTMKILTQKSDLANLTVAALEAGLKPFASDEALSVSFIR